MKRLILFLCVFSVSSQLAWSEELPALPKGPLLLTSTTSAQQNADFWINQLPAPDRVFKTPGELDYFNQEIEQMVAERIDVFSIPDKRAGNPIKEEIENQIKVLRSRGLFGEDNQHIPKDYFDKTMTPRVNLENMDRQIKVGWGAAVRSTSIRALPTNTKMLEEVGDIEFDQLQFTLIKPWTPVAIFHKSRGGDWAFVQSPYSRGWLRIEDIAVFSDKEELRKKAQQKLFLIMTGKEVTLYKDAAFSAVFQSVTMGTRIPLLRTTDSAYEVSMPIRRADGTAVLQTAYLKKTADVSQGFLPLTQRNVLKQAFKLLGARYGWGGQYDGRDCSGFIHDVFLSMGVDMPRNSKEQGFIGTQLGNFTPFLDSDKKIEALQAGAPGMTLVRMPLHIMLYLGQYNGHFYVLHSTWAERVSMDASKDEKRRINQVVVSDLTLNGNSYLGSLFARISSVNEIN